MRFGFKSIISLSLAAAVEPSHAECGLEDASNAAGTTNPSDSSWRSYHKQMVRFRVLPV
jgi:hypothetical protein